MALVAMGSPSQTASIERVLTRVQKMRKASIGEKSSLNASLEEALRQIDGSWKKDFSGVTGEVVRQLLRGQIYEELGKKENALTEYQSALALPAEDTVLMANQILYAVGRLLFELEKYDDAAKIFQKVISLPKADLPKAMKYRSVLFQAQALARQIDREVQLKPVIRKKRWKEVSLLLQKNLRNMRGYSFYPSSLALLLRAELEQGKSDCRRAKELFSKYPNVEEIKDWGPLMPLNKTGGHQLTCSITASGIQTRLRRLSLFGMGERALSEIATLRSQQALQPWTIDTYEIDVRAALGQNQEAMRILLKYAEAMKKNPAFWSILARLTSRMGDFMGSAAAYLKAYELAPRARNASSALFNSAFASYQMQDYDGAEAAFSLLISRFKNIRRLRKAVNESQWHLAWMSYLRGDYQTALARWSEFLKAGRLGRRRRNVAVIPSDRIRYWSAMANLRLGQNAEAAKIFRELIKDPAHGYYSIMAWYHLKNVPGVELAADERSLVDLKASQVDLLDKEAVTEKILDEATSEITESSTTAGQESEVVTEGADDSVGSESSSENSAETSDEGSLSSDSETSDEATAKQELVGLIESNEKALRDPRLQKRLEKIRYMFEIGMMEEVRWELQNLEVLVRNTQDRRTIMTELHRMGRWDRSSRLAELTFGVERIRKGVLGARELWEYTYPRAWRSSVMSSARSVGVSEYLVWSIMRAESHFNAEARSPVGAMGLMQIMPFTGERVAKDLLGQKEFDPHQLADPEVNIRLGARYLRRLSEKFLTSLPLVAASYNAGPHRVQNWLVGFGGLAMDEFIEHIPYIETRNYVKKVARNYQIYLILYRADRGSLDWLIKSVGIRPEVGHGEPEVW